MGGADKARFFGFARGSAAECGAVLDVLKAFDAISVSKHLAGKSRVKRLVSMLVRLGQKARERR
jgi:four helix bundle protein